VVFEALSRANYKLDVRRLWIPIMTTHAAAPEVQQQRQQGKVIAWLARVFKLNPPGLNWGRAIMFLDVMLVPAVVVWSIGHEEYLTSALFGVVYAGVADMGGSYGLRVLRVAVFGLIGAALTALAFAIGGDAWGWLVLAISAVTLVGSLGVVLGMHRALEGLLLSSWFIIALAIAFSEHQAHKTSQTWAQVVAWAGGVAVWIAFTFVVWLIRGRKDLPAPVAEIPGDTSRHPLTAPLIMFAVLRALAMAGAAALAFGLNLSHGQWLIFGAFAAMKPSLDETTVRGGQRLAGALMGAAVAVLLLLIPANEHGLHLLSITHGLDIVAIVLIVNAVAIFFWNYAFFEGAVVAAILILVDLRQPSNYSAEGDRVLWTLCGVAIGTLVMILGGLLAKRAARKAKAQPRAA
jgi:hypothetical protein